MKKILNIGNDVDDGLGDYLRRGGEKIRDNFDDIYYELGDEKTLHSAGSWKLIEHSKTENNTHEVDFGKSFIVDTRGGSIQINLPKGENENYGMVVRLRDVWNIWATNPVVINPAKGDTIKGSGSKVELSKSLMDIELVYTYPSKWEYVNTKRVNKTTSSDLQSVITKEFICKEGQKDFTNIFDGELYNIHAVEVYLRGNMMYYGGDYNTQSEYCSFDSKGKDVALNGENIRLKRPTKEGDVVTIKSYIDGVETYRTSYNTRSVRMNDPNIQVIEEYEDDIDKGYVNFDNNNLEFPFSDFGINMYDMLNPRSIEVFLNGVQLLKNGDADTGGYVCEGADGETASQCIIEGGKWVQDDEESDYSLVFDGTVPVGFIFNHPFEHNDIITIKWFNNVIGTLLNIDGIRDDLDKVYLQSEASLYIRNDIEMKNNVEIKQENVIHKPDEVEVKPTTVYDIFNRVYPVGSLYVNVLNKTNPRDILGFGTWARLSGVTLVGYSDDYNDSVFGQNHDYLDEQGRPTPTSGGRIGQLTTPIKEEHLPSITSIEKAMVEDPDGKLTLGSCLDDTEEEGPAVRNFSITELNFKNENKRDIDLMQPSILVNMWMRME